MPPVRRPRPAAEPVSEPPRAPKAVGLDTETTGLDLHHGCKPFLVTFCDDSYNSFFYEWDVCPHTREPLVDPDDWKEVKEHIQSAGTLYLHHSKFDAAALNTIEDLENYWDWSKVADSLISGHIIGSNRPKDLTRMAIRLLHVDVSKYEQRMRTAVDKCRTMVRLKNSPIGDWRIAKKGDPLLPSAKETVWKNDLWLPRAVIKWVKETGNVEYLPDHKSYEDPEDHPWATITAEYANADSLLALELGKLCVRLVEERGLGAIYRKRMELVPVVYDMEARGVTINKGRVKQLLKDYGRERNKLGKGLTDIAEDKGYELALPKSGNNKSLLGFVFDVLKLPVVDRSGKTGNPKFDKNVLDEYLATLDEESDGYKFVELLQKKRRLDTSLNFLESYERFWLEESRGYCRLHPNLNITGSDTLRFSSNNPNEQNISKQEIDGYTLRYAFGPPTGYEWWSLDAKNIELRIPAYESGEQTLIDLFERPDEPPYYGSTHLLNFHTVYPDLWDKELAKVGVEKVGPTCKKKYASTWYQWCKNGGFAVQYGAVEKERGTADRAFHKPGAHKLIKDRLSALNKHNQWCINFADKHGYIETIPDRTVCPDKGYPLLCTMTERGVLPTVPLSYRTQGTAMWWMMKAMLRCHQRLNEWQSRGEVAARIVMQIHDELVFEFPKGRTDPPQEANIGYIRELADLMELGGDDLGIPTPVGIEYHPEHWGEGVTIN